MKFYYPLKPTRITLDSPLFRLCESNSNFIAQRKKDGWRIQLHKNGNSITIYTRHHKLLKPMINDVDWKEVEQVLCKSIHADSCILDGEFLHRRTTNWKEHFCFWDIFEYNHQRLNSKYHDRKELLDKIVESSEHTRVLCDYTDFKKLWSELDTSADEGIVIKDLNEMLYVNFSKTVKSSRQFKLLLNDPRNG